MDNQIKDTTQDIIRSITNDYLTTEQVMALLGVSRQTIHNWTCAKESLAISLGKSLDSTSKTYMLLSSPHVAMLLRQADLCYSKSGLIASMICTESSAICLK